MNLDRFKFRFSKYSDPKLLYNVKSFDITKNIVMLTTLVGLEHEEDGGWQEQTLSSGLLVQCTGNKDDNNKLIFEGDILECNTEDNAKLIFIVQYYEYHNSGLFLFLIAEKSDLINCEYRFKQKRKTSIGSVYGLKIIGNIYTNPELISKQ